MKKIIALVLILTLLVGCTPTPAPVSSDNQDLSSADDTASVSSVESVADASSETPTTSTVSTASKTPTTTSKPVVEPAYAKAGGVIPTGATYTVKASGKVLKAGEKMPQTVGYGDIFKYGDYEYTFIETGANSEEANDGWLVKELKDKNKVSYGELIGTINGKHLKTLFETFQNCKKMQTAPVIPNTVEVMYETFRDATALKKTPNLPKNLRRMYAAFSGCTALTTITEIPSSVTYMKYTFSGCTALKDVSYLTISSSGENMAMFSECTALEKPPKFSDKVTNLGYVFRNCTALKTAPKIPSSVKYLSNTFLNCSSLTGNIVIDANPTEYTDCFKGVTKPITITGATTLKQELLATQNS